METIHVQGQRDLIIVCTPLFSTAFWLLLVDTYGWSIRPINTPDSGFISNLPLKVFYWLVDILKTLWSPSPTNMANVVMTFWKTGCKISHISFCDSKGSRHFQVQNIYLMRMKCVCVCVCVCTLLYVTSKHRCSVDTDTEQFTCMCLTGNDRMNISSTWWCMFKNCQDFRLVLLYL